MKSQWFEMFFSDERNCWVYQNGDYSYTLFCGDSFLLRTTEDQAFSCHLGLSEMLWYVEIGSEGIKLSLKESERYNISI